MRPPSLLYLRMITRPLSLRMRPRLPLIRRANSLAPNAAKRTAPRTDFAGIAGIVSPRLIYLMAMMRPPSLSTRLPPIRRARACPLAPACPRSP